MSTRETPVARRQKADEMELARLDYEASIQEAADRRNYQQEIGLQACKSTLLVNGGAIIGLLTFIGNKPALHDPALLKLSVIIFAAGVCCALVSLVSAYIGQEWLSNYRTTVAWNYQQDMKAEPRVHEAEQERTYGWILMIVATAFLTFGIGSFVGGAVCAVDAIL